MSREELLEKICLFENSLVCRDDICSVHCDKCEEEMNKMLDEYDAKVRADTIDECIDRIEFFCDTQAECVALLKRLKERKA